MIRWIEGIVSFGIRRPGTQADQETESYIARHLMEFGLKEVVKEKVPVHCCESAQAGLVLGAELKIPCCSIPYTAWTPPGGIEAPAVFIGTGTASNLNDLDLHGKIVVMEARFADFSATALKENATLIHDSGETIPDGILHKANWLITNFPAYYDCLARGAAGFVGLLVDAPIDGCDYWVPYDGFFKDLPGVWVGREHSDVVRRHAEREAGLRLVSLGKTREVDSHNVLGQVPGRGEETILITCHHDAPFASAVEDASGLAVLLALAKHFGSLPGTLNRNLLFVASSGHFHGGIGNRVFVEHHREDLLPKIIAALGVEHIANEVEGGADGRYVLTGRPEVRALFCESEGITAIVRRILRPEFLERSLVLPPYMFGPEPPCDSAPFFTAGIPSLCHISGPLYLFDPEDTLDKVRIQDLLPMVEFFAQLIEGIDQLPLEELEKGLSRKRTDPPAPPPHWFMPPAARM
jgi:hypothetical protein